MTAVDVSYDEVTQTAKVDAVPLGHLSVETGHLYLDDFADGDRKIARQLEQAAPWLDAANKRIRSASGECPDKHLFLVDDYTPSARRWSSPSPPR